MHPQIQRELNWHQVGQQRATKWSPQQRPRPQQHHRIGQQCHHPGEPQAVEEHMTSRAARADTKIAAGSRPLPNNSGRASVRHRRQTSVPRPGHRRPTLSTVRPAGRPPHPTSPPGSRAVCWRGRASGGNGLPSSCSRSRRSPPRNGLAPRSPTGAPRIIHSRAAQGITHPASAARSLSPFVPAAILLLNSRRYFLFLSVVLRSKVDEAVRSNMEY